MIKKALFTFVFSTISLLALDTGETIPQNIQTKLNLEADKLYVIDFFASWCKSCKKELPLVEKVYQDKSAEIIGINVDKNKEDGEKMVNDLALSFPVVYDTEKTLVESFNPLGFPALYYVKNGKVLNVIFGAVDEIDKKIKADMKELK